MSAVTTDPLEAAAAELREAEAARSAIEPLSERHPHLDVDDAYAIQRINRERRLNAGERIVGHKIGLTSLAMQQMLGVSTPDVGSITDRMVIEDGGVLPLDELVAGHVEAEFAFTLAESLRAERISVETLRAAISHVALAAEIIDSRIRDWRISLVDTVADNASSARIVTGTPLPADAARLDSLPGTVVRLYQDEELIGEGPGSAVLGDPLEALRWLAQNLAQQDIHLKAGDIVLAGSVHRMQPLRRGATYSVRADGFPAVRFTVA